MFEGSRSFSPNSYLVNRWRLTDCRRRAWGLARANRNKSVPCPGCAPYPLRWFRTGREDHRHRGIMSGGAGTEPIEAR